MKQHIVQGRGAPTKPPFALLQHYIDLDTGETYIARGTDYKTDWGGPLLDKVAVLDLFNEFEEALSRGEGLNSIVELPVIEVNGKRIVEISLPALSGRFIMVVDPTDSVESYEIHPVMPFNSTIRKGMEFKIFNNTLAEPKLVHGTDVIYTSGSVPITPAIQIKGVVTVKHVAIVNDKREWLVYGDTSRDNTYSATVADNAAKLDGFTRQQIIAEARLMSDNTRRFGGLEIGAFQTDIEADTSLDVLRLKIDALASGT
jgi:hypothetical protein